MFKGYFIRESELARCISPYPDGTSCVWVPINRTTRFKKLGKPTWDGVSDIRPCIFEVEDWLASKPDYALFDAP